MDTAIQSLVDDIARRAPGLVEVWLIGSRANGSATPSSDWDFVAVGRPETLAYLREAEDLHCSDVDFLVVTDGDSFESAWGERPKAGSLKGWNWKQTAETGAVYSQTKWHDAEDGAGVRTTAARARKVWP